MSPRVKYFIIMQSPHDCRLTYDKKTLLAKKNKEPLVWNCHLRVRQTWQLLISVGHTQVNSKSIGLSGFSGAKVNCSWWVRDAQIYSPRGKRIIAHQNIWLSQGNSVLASSHMHTCVETIKGQANLSYIRLYFYLQLSAKTKGVQVKNNQKCKIFFVLSGNHCKRYFKYNNDCCLDIFGK